MTTKSEQELGKHAIHDSHLVTLATLAVHTGNTLGHPWGTLEWSGNWSKKFGMFKIFGRTFPSDLLGLHTCIARKTLANHTGISPECSAFTLGEVSGLNGHRIVT